MAPVTRLELLTLLNDARWATGNFPKVILMRDRMVDVISRALIDRDSIGTDEVDAILAAAHEIGEYRIRYQFGDPYVVQRTRCIDILTRLRSELTDPPPLH